MPPAQLTPSGLFIDVVPFDAGRGDPDKPLSGFVPALVVSDRDSTELYDPFPGIAWVLVNEDGMPRTEVHDMGVAYHIPPGSKVTWSTR
jgi:hypothetical protein